MTLELPWPPTANNLHAVVRGRKVLSRKGREYRAQAAAQLAMQAAPRLGDARLAITLTLHPPDRRRRDIANSEKAAIDALVYAGVLHDDSQIDRLTIVRADPRPGGALTVTLEEIGRTRK
ncbi:MAG TPA: RusA family crossover junction endodeoxyribonuclease [Trueperaceae bacterium]